MDNYYCLKCGELLEPLENSDLLVCSNKHLWDVHHNNTTNEWSFRPHKWATCEHCEAKYPEITGRDMCPQCYAGYKESWMMDSQESYAKLIITPSNGKYHLTSELKIRPYPNPLFGGYWGLRDTQNEVEVDQEISRFQSSLEPYKKHGLIRIEVVDYRKLRDANKGIVTGILSEFINGKK